MRKYLLILLSLPAIAGVLYPYPSPAQKITPLPIPRNVIIMIADGGGFNHHLAAKYYLGIGLSTCEQFPVRLAMATFPAMAGEYDAAKPGSNYFAGGYDPSRAWKDTAWLKRDFTESAAAATALSTGVKTYNNAIGLSVTHDTLENLVQRAKALGRSAGVVTTVPFSHATPAGFVAHNVTRVNYAGIAAEMLLDSRCDVIMGCGDPGFDDNGKPRPGKWNNPKYVADSAFWLQVIAGSGKQVSFHLNGKTRTVQDVNGDHKPDAWTVVRDLSVFQALQTGKTPRRVLGVPKIYQSLQVDRQALNGETKNSGPYVTPFNTTVPSLAEMVGGALNVLDNNPKGFFLMVEGGATDWASHSNMKGRLIEEMDDFYRAVDWVVSWVEMNSSWDETLVIVTGDHETGLLWGDKPFEPLKDNGKGVLPGMTFYSGNHTGSLVPFYAKGAGSGLYRRYADEYDSVRGPFIQNAEVPQLVKLLWNR